MNDLLTIITLVLDLISATIILYVFFEFSHSRRLPFIFRLGLALAASGLLGEATLSVYQLKHIDLLYNSQIIWWLGKDIGLVIFAIYAVFGRWKTVKIQDFSNRKKV